MALKKAKTFGQWAARVQAYCHEAWGTKGLETITRKMWKRWWGTPARRTLSAFDFARLVALPWVCHNHLGMDTLTRGPIREFVRYADLKEIKAREKLNLEYGKNYGEFYKRTVLAPASRIAKSGTIPPRVEDPVVPPVEVGRLEQPPRECPPGMMRMYSVGNEIPLKLTAVTPQAVLIWVESVTDIMVAEGRFPTIECLTHMIHRMPDLDRDEAQVATRALNALYYAEDQEERAALRRMVERAYVDPDKTEKRKEEASSDAPKVRPTSRHETRTGAAGVVTVTEGKKGGKKYRIWGHPVTAVIRWMGADAWTFSDVRKALARLGVPDVSDPTVKAQLIAGKKGGDCDGRGPAADLTADQQDILNRIVEASDEGEAQGRGQVLRRRAEGKERPQAQEPPAPSRNGHAGPESDPAKARTPRVRPADEPARLRGRAGDPDPRKTGTPNRVAGGGKDRAEQRATGRSDRERHDEGRGSRGPDAKKRSKKLKRR